MTAAAGDRLLSVRDTEAILGCSVATVWRRAATGKIPEPVKGSDFAVVKAPIHNPTGKRGKTKPCLKNCDETVVEFATIKTEATQ